MQTSLSHLDLKSFAEIGILVGIEKKKELKPQL